MYRSKVILPRLHSYELLFFFFHFRTDGLAVLVVFRSLKEKTASNLLSCTVHTCILYKDLP